MVIHLDIFHSREFAYDDDASNLRQLFKQIKMNKRNKEKYDYYALFLFIGFYLSCRVETVGIHV